MRWFGRRPSQDISLAVEQGLPIAEIGQALPDVSLDDLMARLWIKPPALVGAAPGAGVVPSAGAPSASHVRPRKSRQVRQERRSSAKLAFEG